MKLNPVGPNQTEVELASGVTVFFSYKTPVAAHIPGRGYVRTDKHYSQTTTRHINQWLLSKQVTINEVETVPQSEIEPLA